MQRIELKLQAGIHNAETEATIYEWLAEILPEYGTKPFNKRLETWLNKQSAEKFGEETIDWGYNEETKTFPRVSFYFRKSDWSDNFNLSFSYKGEEAGYNYDTRNIEIQARTIREELLGVENNDNLIEQSRRNGEHRRDSIKLMQSNLRDLSQLIGEYDDLKKEISAFNESISYIIADDLRIR